MTAWPHGRTTAWPHDRATEWRSGLKALVARAQVASQTCVHCGARVIHANDGRRFAVLGVLRGDGVEGSDR
jgi:hypothetical protein